MNELTSYQPGDLWCVVGSNAVAVFADALPEPRLEEIWGAVAEATSLRHLLTIVTGGRFDDLAVFGLCTRETASGGLSLLARPGLPVRILEAGESTQVDTGSVSLWTEKQLSSGSTVVFGLGGAGIALPIASGVVRASTLTFHGLSGSDRSPTIDAPSSDSFTFIARNDPTSVNRVQEVAPAKDDPGNQWPLEDAGETLVGLDAISDLGLTGTGGDYETSDVATDDEQAEPVAGAGEHRDYDDLFGRTVMRTAADAAVQPHPPDEADVMDRALGSHPPLGGEADPGPSIGPAASRGPRVPGEAALEADIQGSLIDSVPWARGSGPTVDSQIPVQGGAPTQGEPPPGRSVEHDGLTISAAELRRLQGQDAQPSAGVDAVAEPGVPVVHAIHCADGHPNPPQSERCRVCAQPLPYQEPQTVPRPLLGWLTFAEGRQVALDRAVIIGRSPSVDRVSAAGVPHLVKLDSPNMDLSRNHAEVRVDGWQVLVVDLGSTNGTIVTPPDGDPIRLHPHEPTPVVIGTRVVLGHDHSFSFDIQGGTGEDP